MRISSLRKGGLASALLAGVWLNQAIAAAPFLEKINLFEEKTGGFVSYRIPGVVVTAQGTVLAYCEARKNSGADWGEIEIHLRRSTDGGRTFAPVQQVAHRGPRLPRNPVALAHKSGGPNEQTVNNPVAIADRDGTVHFLYCVEYMRCFYLRSADDGVTWSQPIEITSAFEPFRSDWPWRVIATGPGHGIQLRHGRLVVPVWLATSKGSPHANAVGSVIYSDDHGTTWHRGEIAVPNDEHTPGTSETIVAQLGDDRVMLLARTHAKSNRKAVTFSRDGATGWSKPTFAGDLLEPVCMAGLVRWPDQGSGAGSRLLFSNPDSLDRADGKGLPGERRDRKNVSVKLSHDDGRTWPVSRTLEPGPSAYSDVAVLPDGSALCFYESGRGTAAPGARPWPYAFLTLARFNLEWLGGGQVRDPKNAFRIEHSVIQSSPAEFYFTQSRAALIPTYPARVILTTQETEKSGAHGYRDLFDLESSDGGRTWSQPTRIAPLRRQRMPEGHDFVIGDVCPQWHAATQLVLATGKTFGFRGGTTEDRALEHVSYATYSPAAHSWSGLNLLALPATDHEGKPILEPNSGCHQRFDLPNGEILLPIRYRKDSKTRFYTTIVARCRFDGTTLTYLGHGSEFMIPRERGLYEPSVTGFRGRFFLTMRADHSAFVARSQDGVNYEPFIEWTYDDGTVLGSYNTQQHWVTRHDVLYLVYTRRGANNDHVYRSRAPLFIARVDSETLRVIRSTEQILIPESGSDLGNFGVMDFSPNETWVVTSESPPAARSQGPNRILLARLIWNTPNEAFGNPGR